MKRSVYEEVIHYCKEQLPFEACGLLSGESGIANTLWKMENVQRSPVSFAMDMIEVKNVFDIIKSNGELLTGIFHSHPTDQAYPSRQDIANAHYPEAAYCIVSFSTIIPVMKCFHIKDGYVFNVQIRLL